MTLTKITEISLVTLSNVYPPTHHVKPLTLTELRWGISALACDTIGVVTDTQSWP